MTAKKKLKTSPGSIVREIKRKTHRKFTAEHIEIEYRQKFEEYWVYFTVSKKE